MSCLNIMNDCTDRQRRETDQDEGKKIYMFLPYCGKEAESVVFRCKKRLTKLFKKDINVEFRIHFQSTKLSFFTSNKDKTPLLSSSCLVYQFSCPGCMKSYIGKTESTLFNRTKVHGWLDKQSAINRHFHQCQPWKDIVGNAISNKRSAREHENSQKIGQLVEVGISRITGDKRSQTRTEQRDQILQRSDLVLNPAADPDLTSDRDHYIGNHSMILYLNDYFVC